MEEDKLVPVKQEITGVVSAAEALTIRSAEDLPLVADFLQKVAQAKRKIADVFGPQKKATHLAWQSVIAQEKKFLGPLESAEAMVKHKKTDFDIEQQKTIDRMREEAERKAAAKEEQMRARLLKKMEMEKDPEKVAVLQEKIEEVHVDRQSVPEMTKVEGIATQKDFDVEVFDLPTLMAAVIDGSVGISAYNLFDVRKSVLKTYVKMTGRLTIPGCRVKDTLIQRVVGKR